MNTPDRSNPFDLTGARALITGSGQGIGLALARGLAEAGAAIVLNGRGREKIERAAAKLRQEGFPVDTAVFDVTDRNAVISAIDEIESKIGAIDILINNAGIQHRAPLEDFPAEAWERIVNTNLSSVFHVSQAVVKHMIPRGEARSSISVRFSVNSAAPPSLPMPRRRGVAMLTKGMCVDWAKYGIQVNGIAPGYIKTELNRALIENREFSDWLCKRTPAGRWGNVEELCGTAVFLSSKASDFVTGQIIFVDGGLTSSV